MILKPNEENIIKAAGALIKGDIVAFPTETVYGLGGDATNPIAVSKIFEVKERPSFNPLIVHITNFEQFEKVAVVTDDRVKLLVNKFWPGPLTVVLPKRDVIPDIVTAGHETVAVRMPANEIARKLIDQSGKPIAAPSANAFGFLSPTKAEHVEKQLGGKIEIIIDGGNSSVGVESTIVEFRDEKSILLRPGGLAIDEIEKVVGPVEHKSQNTAKPKAPGMLLHHYAPKVKIHFINEADLSAVNKLRTAVLAFDNSRSYSEFHVNKILSETGELHEAAANLFKHLHTLENEDIDLILVEKVPETGLGIAIMDRLSKAANRYR